MKKAVEIFTHPDVEAFAVFASNLSKAGAGDKWKTLSDIVLKRVLPARDVYFKAVAAAEADRVVMTNRQESDVKTLASLREQIVAIEDVIANRHPVEREAADAAPAALAVTANESLLPEDVAAVAAALKLYVDSLK